MQIFISHYTADVGLAEAWRSLLSAIGPGVFQVWHAGDVSPNAGVAPGRWREQIGGELTRADAVLSIFTPESSNRPWIFFESGFAAGLADRERLVIPILYYMDASSLPSPLRDWQAYQGDEGSRVVELCTRLYAVAVSASIETDIAGRWQSDIEAYLDRVERHAEERQRKALFYGDFHTSDTADKLSGQWFAMWTCFEDDRESIWQIQPIVVENAGWRIRMVGEAQQGVLSPFEGVVSSRGHIPLCYWVEGETAICGTVLLEQVGSMLEGLWQGYTARTLQERLSFKHGRVVMSRTEEALEGYWDLGT